MTTKSKIEPEERIYIMPNDNSGTSSRRKRSSKKRGSFVRVLIKDTAGCLLLMEERKNTLWPIWNFPGGKVDENEHPKDAAKRELKEELSIEATQLTLLCKGVYSFNKEKWDGFYFLCEPTDLASIRIMEKEKCSRVSFFSETEMAELLIGAPQKIMHLVRQ